MKSGDLNFLEPSGTLQACNGTALPIFAHLTLLLVAQIWWNKTEKNMQREIDFLFITERNEKFSVNVTSNGDGGGKKNV